MRTTTAGEASSLDMYHFQADRRMTLAFTYMGTKRQIAGQVAEIIARAPDGPLLDAFAGMAAVGSAVAVQRPIWCNDVQLYPYSVTRSFFKSRSHPKVTPGAASRCKGLFYKNKAYLHDVFGSIIAEEARAYQSGDIRQIYKMSECLIDRAVFGSCADLRAVRRHNSHHVPYCLFTTTYSGGYIGLDQAVEIDSLRFAIDELKNIEAVDSDTYQWMLVALCLAFGRISNSTGHFAQYLSIKERTKERFLIKRRRSAWREWQSALDGMRPLGTKKWRRSNRMFQSEAIELLRMLGRRRLHPSVIYCDPPYTKDQYSRYYHLMDTLLLYDYPEIESKGQYRRNRFRSPFSVKSLVNDSFRTLIDAASQLKATLVVSYPDRGLLTNPRKTLVGLLKERFADVDVAAELLHEHSSLGASNGVESAQVRELVFVARG